MKNKNLKKDIVHEEVKHELKIKKWSERSRTNRALIILLIITIFLYPIFIYPYVDRIPPLPM